MQQTLRYSLCVTEPIRAHVKRHQRAIDMQRVADRLRAFEAELVDSEVEVCQQRADIAGPQAQRSPRWGGRAARDREGSPLAHPHALSSAY